MEEDVLYHLALGSGTHDLSRMFGDVRSEFPLEIISVFFCNLFRRNFTFSLMKISICLSAQFPQNDVVETNVIEFLMFSISIFDKFRFCAQRRQFSWYLYLRFVCMGGTPQRMKSFAEYMLKELGYVLPTGTCLLDISERSHRYTAKTIFKVGCNSYEVVKDWA